MDKQAAQKPTHPERHTQQTIKENENENRGLVLTKIRSTRG